MSKYKIDEEEEEKLSDIYYYADNFSWTLPLEAINDRKYYTIECLKGTLPYLCVQAIFLYFCVLIDKVVSLNLTKIDDFIHEDAVTNFVIPSFSIADNYKNTFYRTDR